MEKNLEDLEPRRILKIGKNSRIWKFEKKNSRIWKIGNCEECERLGIEKNLEG